MSKTAIIVSHGQPSDPVPAAADLAVLARAVAAHLPEWQVRSATLAEPGALARVMAGAGGGVIYPLFMAGGWFVTTHLPKLVAEADAGSWRILAPFGLDGSIQDLCLTLATEAAAAQGRTPGETAVLLAAHGSFRSPAPSEVARAMAQRLVQQAGFARAEAYFIDQEPRIATAAGFGAAGICLPFFAAKGGHVTDDLPAALHEAQFGGLVLPPLGSDHRVPALIAAAIIGAD